LHRRREGWRSCADFMRGWRLYIYIYICTIKSCFPLASPAVCDHTRYTIKQICTTIYRTVFAVDEVVELNCSRNTVDAIFYIPYRIKLLLSDYDNIKRFKTLRYSTTTIYVISLVSRRSTRYFQPQTYRIRIPRPFAAFDSVFIIWYYILPYARYSLLLFELFFTNLFVSPPATDHRIVNVRPYSKSSLELKPYDIFTSTNYIRLSIILYISPPKLM